MMHTCSFCKRTLALTPANFAWRNKAKQTYQSQCRTCQAEYRKRHYQDNRQKYIDKARRWDKRYRREVESKLVAYFNDHPCVDCGMTDIRALQFDHRDPTTKEFSVSLGLVQKYSWKRLSKEIEKCDVRCASCHTIRTAQQFGFWSDKHLRTLDNW